MWYAQAMNQSPKTEAFAESIDLERFARAVKALPTVSDSKIDKMVSDAKAKRPPRKDASKI